MAQRRHQYERAFESFLRARQIPYVAVNEARKAILPDRAALRVSSGNGRPRALKSFDFITYGSGTNLIIEVKGRRLATRNGKPGSRPRLESWVTLDDIDSLNAWQGLFGSDYEPVFVFVYRCDAQPPDGLFQEVYEFAGDWYMLRAVRLSQYVENMRTRSPRWRTVHLSTATFAEISQPFAPSRTGDLVDLGPELPVFEPLSA